MLFTTALSLFLAFWSGLFLIDFYLRSAGFKRYLDFVERHGLIVTPFQVRLYTNRYGNGHQLLHPFAGGHRVPHRFVSTWFAIGAGVALICFVGVAVYLTQMLYGELQSAWTMVLSSDAKVTETFPDRNIRREQSGGLQPVVPGVNVPWSHLPLFLAVLIIAGVVHELGHALAASNENVQVNGFGIFLLAVYPGAFTEIHSESLARSTTSQKLRIYGAGIWHNLLLAVVAVGVLYGLPTLLYPLYSMDKGILVTDVASRSGLSGDAGLRPGHVIYAINQCGVRNQQDWGQCVQELANGDDGYCMANEEVVNRIVQEVVNVYGEMQCCDDANTSLSHLCFFFYNKSTSIVHDTVVNTVSQRPKLMDALGVKNSGQIQGDFPLSKSKNDQRTATGDTIVNYACLPARHVTDHSTCGSRDHSSRDVESHVTPSCSSGSICVYPALFNQTKLIRFRIANLSRPVLFIGHVNELRYYVRVSDFVPRLSTILAPVWLPRAIDLFCRYLVTFSLAMALLNAVPCFSLDGQYICQTLTEAFCHKWPQRRRQSLTNLILYYGTFLLCANVVIGFVKFFYANYYYRG